MSTLIFYLSLFGLGLVVLSFIPGLSELVKPLIQLLTTAASGLFMLAGSWLVVVIKQIVGAHIQFLRHLVSAPESIDPTLAVRDDQ